MSQPLCPYCKAPVTIIREGVQQCPHCHAVIGVMDGQVIGIMRS
jgi:hypothetical protein